MDSRFCGNDECGVAVTTENQDALSEIASAATLADLEAIRVRTLGKSGTITALLKTLGGMTPEQRQAEGPKIHALREAVTTAIADRKASLEGAALEARLATERLDMSLPVSAGMQGSVHPVAQVMDELAEIFADLGFAVATGPEIEDDWHNFTALNIPETHPARAMHDTFYFPENQMRDGKKMLLRTHTSPVQIRTMMAEKPPIRIIAPGRTYRSDSDATHTPMFHQVEGLVIDRGIHMGHLKWTLETFLKAYFERDDIVLRLRPSYFPLHRAVGRGRCRLHLGKGPPRDRWRSDGGQWRLDGDSRLGDGPSPGDRPLRPRSRRMAGLRLRLRHRSARDAQIWDG